MRLRRKDRQRVKALRPQFQAERERLAPAWDKARNDQDIAVAVKAAQTGTTVPAPPSSPA